MLFDYYDGSLLYMHTTTHTLLCVMCVCCVCVDDCALITISHSKFRFVSHVRSCALVSSFDIASQ